MRITTKQLIFLAYFLGIFILSRISSFRFSLLFFQSVIWDLILWMTGAVLGGYFVKIDQLLYVYFTHPEAPLSLEIKELLKKNPTSLKLRGARRREAWNLLSQRVGEQKLAFRSALFQAGWTVLAFFTLTSTNVIFGKTMVMAVGLHLLLDEWEAILSGRGISWIFWQIKREVGVREQKTFVWAMTGIFCILSLLLI